MTYYPTRVRLVLAWVALLVLTLGAGIAGKAAGGGTLGLAAMTMLMLITWVKTSVILRVYLNLRVAPVWADILTILTGIVLAVILSFYVLAASR